MKPSACLLLAISLVVFITVDAQMGGGIGLQGQGGSGILRQMVMSRLASGQGLGNGQGGFLRQRIRQRIGQRLMGGSGLGGAAGSGNTAGGAAGLDLLSAMGTDGIF